MIPTLRSLVLLLLALPGLAARAGTALESGFTDVLYSTLPIGTPTCIAWAPDGSNRLFVALQEGSVRIVENGTLRVAPFATIKAYTESECGVLGLCFDPHYAQNRYVYVFVTISRTEQRILRFTDVKNLGAARTNLVTKLPTLGQNHDGGALGFGQDGKLYWGIGDLGDKRGVDGELRTLAAKVGRANADGTVPTDNPFNDGKGLNNDYIWATGFRNPFTLTFQPRTGKLFLNVVGSTADGQTDPNGGPGYEQVFALSAGEDGGYDDYEGNQPDGARYTTPFTRPFAHPVLQYKTGLSIESEQVRAMDHLLEDAGNIIVTTTSLHPFRVGQAVVLSDVGVYNGIYTVTSLPSPTSFVVPNTANLLHTGFPPYGATGGRVAAFVIGSSLTGGTFYESSAFPSELRGTFFFADFTGDVIVRADIDSLGHTTGIRPFISQAAAPVDIAVGPDGALYYASIGEGSIRRVSYAAASPALVVTPTVLPIREGGSGVSTVRLSSAPVGEVTVHLERSTGAPELALSSTSDLTFTAGNWSVPQAVILASTPDVGNVDQTATFQVSATGYPTEEIDVKATDTSAQSPVLSSLALSFTEGATGTFTVQLPSPPPRPVTLTIRRTAGPRTIFSRNAAFVFTAKNWNVPRTVLVVGRADTNATDEIATFTVAARGYDARRVIVTVREPRAE